MTARSGTALFDGTPVAVIGNGPVGQTTALLLARWGVRVILLDQRPARDVVGSKSICQQRDVLDIWASVGADRIAREGLAWTTARTFYRDRELFSWSFADPGRSALPPCVNISQSRTEAILDDRIGAQPLIDVRWGQEVTGIAQDSTGVTLTGDSGTLQVSYAVLCAGARAESLRQQLGVTFEGESFDDRFLICDIRADLPGWENERRFYFDPVWNPDRQVLIHPVPGLDVPDRLAGARGLRPGRRARGRPAGRADPADRRRAPVRDRLAVGVPVPVPVCEPHARRPGAARRGLCSPVRAVRRPRPELRRSRRRERGLEARVRPARLGAGGTPRDLPPRTARGCAREPRRHQRDHEVPGAAGRARTGRGDAPSSTRPSPIRPGSSTWTRAASPSPSGTSIRR